MRLAIRALVLFVLAQLALVACATDAARARDVARLEDELASQRAVNERLSARIERLENAQVVQGTRAAAATPVPELTVIKLKPRTDPAPKLDTSVTVVEPPKELVHEGDGGPPQTSNDADEDPAAAEADYDRGVRELKTGNVSRGVARLLKFADAHPNHSKADNALYFAGLGQMGEEAYPEAAGTFEKLLAEHPAGDSVGDALLKLAECRQRLHQNDDAKSLYTQVVLNYPGTAAATQAEQRLSKGWPR